VHKTRLIIIIMSMFFLGAANGFCQPRTAAAEIMEAKSFIQQGSNTASREKFEQAHNILTRCTSQGDHQALAEYYLGYIDYQMAVAVYRMDKEKAPISLDSAIMHLEKALQINDSNAETHALLASCYGMQIAFSPMSGIWLGPKSGSEMGKAREFSKENPRVALLEAIGTYNTPAMFGGGKDKGYGAMKRSAELFDRWKTTDSLQPDWGKEQVYAWIGLANLDRKETILARKAFEKALEINPDYGWVKYVLMPKVASEVEQK
jgi:tetratricopeptide (TPR) repeat protein